MGVFKNFIVFITAALMLSSCSSDSKKIEGLTSVYRNGNLRSLVSLANESGDLSCRYYSKNGADSAEIRLKVNLKLNYEAPFLQNLTEEEAIEQITHVSSYFSFYDAEWEEIGRGLTLELQGEEFIKFYKFLKGKKGSTESFVFTKSETRDPEDDVKGIIKTIDYFIPGTINAPLSWELWATLSKFSVEKGYLGEAILEEYTEIWEGFINPAQNIDPQNMTALSNRTQILLALSKDLTEELLKYPNELSSSQRRKFYELEKNYKKITKDRLDKNEITSLFSLQDEEMESQTTALDEDDDSMENDD